MTEDEKAAAVLALLADAIPCPGCQRPMRTAVLTHDISGQVVGGWECLQCYRYLLRMGKDLIELAPGDRSASFTFRVERDFTFDETTGKWIRDE